MRSALSTKHLNCKAIFERNTTEIQKAKDYMTSHKPVRYTDSQLTEMTANCTRFTHDRAYMMNPLTEEERKYPLAYSILFYRDADQLERLLRAIYAPQNIYCIHVDAKTPQMTRQSVLSLARCFPNVFVSSRMYDVWWGHITLLHAELSCMRDLLQFDWLYMVNMAAQMFPLRTNHEIVKITKLLGGANDVQGLV
jgi:hypothetical protein